MSTINLDNALAAALQLPAETPFMHLQRTIKVSNLKGAYKQIGLFWPALDAKQRAVFDACEKEAREIGIER
jgi:hypothetical protein